MKHQTSFTQSSGQKMAKLKTLSVWQKYFFSIKLLHAYLPYVCNISAQCWKDPVKTLMGVQFTKYGYALSTIIYYVELSEHV